MLTVPDFHGQNAPKEELEKVVILPAGLHAAGSYTLPDGYKWSDFEYVEGSHTLTTASDNAFDGNTYPKEWLQVGNKFMFRDTTATFTQVRGIDVEITSGTEFDLIVPGTANAGSRLAYLIGYKKRYATKNLSRTISVNLGNDIAVNSRYEVDLPSEFYEADGSIKKGVNVRAEVYNDGALGGSIGWGEAGFNWTDQSLGVSYGANASVFEDRVIVQTGINGILASGNLSGAPFGLLSGLVLAAPCQVIATLNDAYILSVEPAQGSFERIVNAGLDVLEFTNNGDYAYMPLSDTDFDGDIFEYNSTTRFLRPKKSGKHIPSVFSHAEDGAGQARVKYVLVQADTAQGDNPVVVSGVFTKQYTNDGGTQSIHAPINLDESKWYALYAENFTSGNVTYTSLVSPTSEPDLGDITDYAFIFSLERG